MKSRNIYELGLMRRSGVISGSALKKATQSIKIGATGLEIDKIAEREIYKLGGDLSYKTVPGYKFATCVTVNDAVVHGLPTKIKFAPEDIVSVDLAVVYKGWHTDCAWTILLGQDAEKLKFLKVGEEALYDGIDMAVSGNRIGDISHAIGSKVEGAGYKIVRSLVGHGIGQNLHEEPEVPGFGNKGNGVLLKEGMTLAIEVIYTKGSRDVILGSDGWTYFSSDGSWGGLFEMTVIVGKNKAEVLTAL